MKSLCATLLFSLSLSTLAADLPLAGFNWSLDDVKSKELSKEQLYRQMDRDLIKLGQSICANRALIWLYQFKKDFDVDGAKIFLFYTNKTGTVGSKKWWYHVAPVLNEDSTEYVMDAGFPGKIDSPLLVKDWLYQFVGSESCYEIQPADRDLIEMMNQGQMFPRTTHRGNYDCYTLKAPAGYWFPGTIASNLLGTEITAEEISREEVYQACKEASTSPIGRILGQGKNKCRKLVN